jgi:hypothetical protein
MLMTTTTQAPLNLAEPWHCKFNQYLTGHDKVPDGLSLPQWLGVRYCNLLFIQLTFNLITTILDKAPFVVAALALGLAKGKAGSHEESHSVTCIK